MKKILWLTLALLAGTGLIFAAPRRANSVRSGSGYGVVSSPEAVPGLGEQWLVPLSATGGVNGDVLLQISFTAADLGDPSFSQANPRFA